MHSLRRAQEFQELAVGEWNERLTIQEKAVVKIRKHKSMTFVSTEVLLNSVNDRAAITTYT